MSGFYKSPFGQYEMTFSYPEFRPTPEDVIALLLEASVEERPPEEPERADG